MTASQHDWTALLDDGDSTCLITVFKEAVVTDSVDLPCISEFLESHLFVHTLGININELRLCSSAEDLDILLAPTYSYSLDAREVLTELLSFNEFAKCGVADVYLRLLGVTFRQVFFDTIRRGRGMSTVDEKLRRARKTMKAWYAGFKNCVLGFALKLFRKDALPQATSTTKELYNKSNDIEGVEAGRDLSDDELGSDDASMVLALKPGVLKALSIICMDTVSIIDDPRETVSFALIINSIIHASQKYDEMSKFMGKIGKDSYLWATEQCQVNHLRPHKLQTKDPLNTHAKEMRSEENMEEFSVSSETLTRTFLNLIPRSGVVDFLVEHFRGITCSKELYGVTFEDNERGKSTSDHKAVTMFQDLNHELSMLQVHQGGDNTLEEMDDFETAMSSLQKMGALLLLHNIWVLDNSECHHLISMSPTTIFFFSSPLILESLQSTSLCIIMNGLTFLCLVLQRIPAYSICTPGEERKDTDMVDEIDEERTKNSISFQTKKFERLFELIKALLNISSLCPSKAHRVIAKALVFLFFQRSAIDLRLRLYSAFLIISPYASICSMMLFSLQKEWNGNKSEATHEAHFLSLKRRIPLCLLRAQDNWVRRLHFGEFTFMDPLIQSFNFIRTLIAESRRQLRSDIFSCFDSQSGKVKLTRACKAKEGDWEKLLRNIFSSIVPELRVMIKCSDNSTEKQGGIMGVIKLSPLDSFSLSFSLDGLEKDVFFAE